MKDGITHFDGCPRGRVEVTESRRSDDVLVAVARCLECGATARPVEDPAARKVLMTHYRAEQRRQGMEARKEAAS